MARNLRTLATEGLLWGLGGKLVLIAANFAVLVVTSRALSPAEFGVFAAATIFIDLSWVLANATLGVSLIQRKDLSEQELRAGFMGYVLLAAAVAALLAVGAGLLERLMQAPGLTHVLYALAALLPLRLLAGFYGAIVQRRLEFRFHQFTQSFPQILGAFATIAGALGGWSVWSLVLGFGIGCILEFALLFAKAKFTHRLPHSWRAIQPLLETAFASASQRLLNFFATNVDRFVIGATLGPAALALYTRAYSLMMVPVKLVGMTLSRVLLAVFSKIQDDDVRLGRAVGRVVEAQAVLHLPLGLGLAWSTPLLVQAVLGSAWVEAIVPAQLFFFALIARLGTVPLDAALVGSGQAWTVARLQSAYAVMTFCAAAIGALVGLVAVASGVTLALLALYAMELAVTARRFSLSGQLVWRWHIKGLVLSLAAAAGPALVALSLRGSDGLLAPSIFEVAGYWVTFAACILLCPERVVGAEVARARSMLIDRILRRKRT